MSKKKLKLTYTEIQVVNLESFVSRNGVSDSDIRKAKDLITWYKLNGYFTKAQMSLAKNLTYIKKKPEVIKKHYLYAISNGEQVKLGMSSDVNKRLKSLQTSSPSELSLLWKYYIANTPKDAVKIEKMLHRACSKFHVRGEWFSMGCIDIVNSFNPNKKHCAKWDFATLISIEPRRRGGVLNFTTEKIRRNKVTSGMRRVFEQESTEELYQVEIKKHLDDGEVVLVCFD